MAVYPRQFQPSAPDDLVRIGARYDGGYVLPQRIIGASRGLLSFGLSDEWTFEADFCRAADARVVCFDPSVTPVFWLRKLLAGVGRGALARDWSRVQRGFRVFSYRKFFDGRHNRHIRAPIGTQRNSVGLAQAITSAALAEPIFLKMDIEGSEYRILPDIVTHRHRFTGFAIEFHDVDLHEARIVQFIEDVADAMVLVHFHVNSHTTVLPDGHALVVEMTFMSRTLLTAGETLTHRPLPIAGLDQPNLPDNVELPVSFRAVA